MTEPWVEAIESLSHSHWYVVIDIVIEHILVIFIDICLLIPSQRKYYFHDQFFVGGLQRHYWLEK